LAQITVTEAKMIQTLKDTKIKKPNKMSIIQTEIDGLLDAGLTSEDIEPALYDKCMEALKC
jgi:formate-dependent nitrite reductase cytochrome c552 subunit